MQGNFHKYAILYASNNWPWFDAPSPYNARQTPPFPLYLHANATPAPNGHCYGTRTVKSIQFGSVWFRFVFDVIIIIQVIVRHRLNSSPITEWNTNTNIIVGVIIVIIAKNNIFWSCVWHPFYFKQISMHCRWKGIPLEIIWVSIGRSSSRTNNKMM